MDYPPHSLGARLPHHHPNVDHSRSRYRGQPPSQPYYLFQWNLNPYHRYGQSLSALPCMRPHVARRPDMYPGYWTSQAMGYPADYKRGFNSHSSSPVAPGFHRGYARRTGTSADQRDPRGPLCKLVERLDGLSTKEEEEEEEEYLPQAPPPGRGPPWSYPAMGELKGTGVDPQEHQPPRREQGPPWAPKAGPRPPHSRAAVPGIRGAFPLDSSSANEEEEEEEPLCLVGAGRPSVWSSSVDGQSSAEDVSERAAPNLDTRRALTAGGGGGTTTERSAAVTAGGGGGRSTTERNNAAGRRSLEDGGKEICVPPSASRPESPEADADVCACCGASLEEEDGDDDDRPGGDPGERLHGSPFEAAPAGTACSFVEEMATNDMRDGGAEMMGRCLMPGQLVQRHCWYPCACPPDPHAPPPLGPRHPTRRLWSRAAGQCPCGELEGAPRTIHDPRGSRGYERAPHDCPPSGLRRSKAKDNKQKRPRGGAQPRSYEDSWGNGCSKYRPWSSRPYRGPDDQGSLQNERPSWESFSRNMPWRADRQYEVAPDSHYGRGRGATKRRGTLQ